MEKAVQSSSCFYCLPEERLPLTLEGQDRTGGPELPDTAGPSSVMLGLIDQGREVTLEQADRVLWLNSGRGLWSAGWAVT